MLRLCAALNGELYYVALFSDGDEDYGYCEYCDFPYPLTELMPHQENCSKAPSEALITVRDPTTDSLWGLNSSS